MNIRILSILAATLVLSACVDPIQKVNDAYPLETSDRKIITRYGDGLPLVVHLPEAGGQPHPVMIINHGRPFRSDVGEGIYKTSRQDPLVFRLNKAGIAAAYPIRSGYFSAPGGDGERIACNSPTGGQFSRALASGRDDILGAISALRAIERLDSDNVFVAGQSAGGFLALAAMDGYPESVRGVISFNGGRCGNRGPLFNGISYAADLIAGAATGSSVPVMIVASANDKIIPPASSGRLRQAVCDGRGGCGSVSLYNAERVGHSLSNTAIQAGDAVIAFVERHLN